MSFVLTVQKIERKNLFNHNILRQCRQFFLRVLALHRQPPSLRFKHVPCPGNHIDQRGKCTARDDIHRGLIEFFNPRMFSPRIFQTTNDCTLTQKYDLLLDSIHHGDLKIRPHDCKRYCRETSATAHIKHSLCAGNKLIKVLNQC